MPISWLSDPNDIAIFESWDEKYLEFVFVGWKLFIDNIGNSWLIW